jgi:hypothetical protein
LFRYELKGYFLTFWSGTAENDKAEQAKLENMKEEIEKLTLRHSLKI